MKIKEINERLNQIVEEAKGENVDFDKLTEERDALLAERAVLESDIEKRQNLLDTVTRAEDLKVISKFKEDTKEERQVDKKEMAINYRNAFLKKLLGEQLTEVEERAYTHTTANTDAVIPTELQNKIYSTMEEAHPILKDVQILRTGAVISIVKHTEIAAGDAKIVGEGVANDDEENTFVNVTLSGKDFSKHVDFSYRLGKMAIPAFEQYLVKEIADRIGAAMAADIIAQIKTDLATGNKFDAATPGTLDKADILKALGLLKGAGKVNVYANNSTFYNGIANMEGTEGLLSFIPNYQEQISGQLFGKAIKEEDALAEGEVLILDPNQFIYNIVQDIMLERDRDIKKHVHTISGFAIAEGTMTNDKAGTVITVGVAG